MVSLTLKVPNRAQQVGCYKCMCVRRVRMSDNVVVLHHRQQLTDFTAYARARQRILYNLQLLKSRVQKDAEYI